MDPRSSNGAARVDPWPSHWSVTLGLVAGLGLGFLVQSELHASAHTYAKAVGIPKFLVQFALVFGPLLLAVPFAKLLRVNVVALQAFAALAIGFLIAGYFGLALEFVAWFIGW
ncbi:MAG: hypothetical protein U1F17_13565 [Burkholderiaceae bacterium]